MNLTPPRPPSRHELRAHPAVRQCTLFCLAALFLLVVCLVDRGLGWWAVIPALIGGMALLGHWSFGPPLALVSLAILLLSEARYRWGQGYWLRNQAPTLMDVVLCLAMLAYAVGHYRLLSLVRHVFPPDPRRPADGPRADPARRRSADLATPRETVMLVMALPLWVGAAVLAWYWVSEDVSTLGVPIDLWRALRIAWVGLTVLAAVGVVAGYRRLTTATPDESLLYLQDQLWRQTRREQSSLNRWLAWARLRGRRGEETS